MQRFGHDKSSTFGIGRELAANEWRGLFRQLIARGLLAVDIEGHGSLKLTDACRPVLRGEERLMLRREIKVGKTKKAAPRASTVFAGTTDSALWEALRARRRQLALDQGVPPYVVFHDATLTQMIERRPRTLSEFGEISGVGERKLAAYGQEFLEIILAHTDQDEIPTPPTPVREAQPG
jgi:ATP-dependent DNA helicase RecQ